MNELLTGVSTKNFIKNSRKISEFLKYNFKGLCKFRPYFTKLSDIRLTFAK